MNNISNEINRLIRKLIVACMLIAVILVLMWIGALNRLSVEAIVLANIILVTLVWFGSLRPKLIKIGALKERLMHFETDNSDTL